MAKKRENQSGDGYESNNTNLGHGYNFFLRFNNKKSNDYSIDDNISYPWAGWRMSKAL